MTIDIPTRPAEQQAPPEPRRRGLKSGPQITLRRSQPKKQMLVVGGQPRANLLPPEVVLKRKQLKTRRALRVGVFFVFVGTVAACGAVWALATGSQVALTASQDQLAALAQEQLGYSEVRDVQSTIETIKAGQQVGSSTEINFTEYLRLLQASLPEGMTLKTAAFDLGTPMVAYAQSDTPLQGERVGSITFSTSSATLPTTGAWLRSLEKLPGFVDATPGSVTLDNGAYTSQVVMHIDGDAFSMRFDPERIAEEEAHAAAAAASDGTVKSMTAETPEVPVETGADGSAADGSTEEGGQ